MTPEQARTRLFADSLTFEGVLPVHLHPRDVNADNGAELRLRAIALVEDGHVEDIEERKEHGVIMQRLEAKMDLLLALCGRLLANQQHSNLTPTPVQWSPLGLQLSLPSGSALPQLDQPLGISIQAAEWLPDPLTLPVTVIARDSGNPQHLWLAFDQLSVELGEAIERHIFRLHRRDIAHRRRQR